MFYYLGYDHARAFFDGSRFESRLDPTIKDVVKIKGNYFWTRIENIAEIAIFLPFGVLVLLFHSEYLKLRIFDLHDNITAIFLAGIISLFLFMLTGAYRTGGETARACLYIYPFFMIILRKVEEPVLCLLIIIAGLQTILMQTGGSFEW